MSEKAPSPPLPPSIQEKKGSSLWIIFVVFFLIILGVGAFLAYWYFFRKKPCKANTDCPSGELCQAGTCAIGCLSSSDCNSGEMCVNGKCQAQCYNNAQCPSGHICRDGTCHEGCQNDADCQKGEICTSGICKMNCNSLTGCPTGKYCSGDGYCELGSGMNVGGICNSKEQCLYGLNCNGTCQKIACQSDANCPSGTFCLGDETCGFTYKKDGETCQSHNECLYGRICFQNVCQTYQKSGDIFCTTNTTEIPGWLVYDRTFGEASFFDTPNTQTYYLLNDGTFYVDDRTVLGPDQPKPGLFKLCMGDDGFGTGTALVGPTSTKPNPCLPGIGSDKFTFVPSGSYFYVKSGNPDGRLTTYETFSFYLFGFPSSGIGVSTLCQLR